MRRVNCLRPCIAIALLIGAADAARADSSLSVEWPAADNLHYREALFHLYSEEPFRGITRLRAADDAEFGPRDRNTARLLLGGLYLAYGLDAAAADVFRTTLRKADIRSNIGDYLWFYLAKLRYQRGELDASRQALANIAGILPWQLQEERQLLSAMLAMHADAPDQAVRVLERMSSRSAFAAYGHYNLGVAYLSSHQNETAITEFERLVALDTQDAEVKAIKDMAHLALGHLYMQHEEYARAIAHYEQVDASGPLAQAGLQGQGLAYSAAGRQREALVPWSQLDELGAASPVVTLSVLAIPYNLAKLGANTDTLRRYADAAETYRREIARLTATIDYVQTGTMIESLRERNSGVALGWRRSLSLASAPEQAPYLAPLLAEAGFQTLIRDYLELVGYIEQLAAWEKSLSALTDVVVMNQSAIEARLPSTRTKLAAVDLGPIEWRLEDYERRAAAAAMERDILKIATPQQRLIWGRLAAIELQLKQFDATTDVSTPLARVTALQRALRWQVITENQQRTAQATQDLREVRENLAALQRQLASVRDTVATVGRNAGGVAMEQRRRIGQLQAKRAALQPRVQQLAERLETLVTAKTVEALEQRRSLLHSYLAQTYLALAQLYDTPHRPAGTAE